MPSLIVEDIVMASPVAWLAQRPSRDGTVRPWLACLLARMLACSSMACSLARLWPARLLGLLARLWPSPARDGAVRLYRRILGLPRCALTPKHPLVSLHPLFVVRVQHLSLYCQFTVRGSYSHHPVTLNVLQSEPGWSWSLFDRRCSRSRVQVPIPRRGSPNLKSNPPSRANLRCRVLIQSSPAPFHAPLC